MRLARLLRLPLLMIALALGGLALASPAAAATATPSTIALPTWVGAPYTAGHHHPSTVTIKGGYTSLTVDAGTVKVLTKNKVAVTAISPAYGKAPTFYFPIKDGKVDAKTLAGYLNHRGGLQFKVGKTTLGVKDFTIDTKQGVLTARVAGTQTRVPLLKLDLSKAKISKPEGKVVVSNVRATLTAEAAAALNTTFKVTLFKKGLLIGTAKINAKV